MFKKNPHKTVLAVGTVFCGNQYVKYFVYRNGIWLRLIMFKFETYTLMNDPMISIIYYSFIEPWNICFFLF